MKFSSKAHYGLRAVVELAQAYSHPLPLSKTAQAAELFSRWIPSALK